MSNHSIDLVNNDKANKDKFIAVFLTTFSTVFIAELGDKTQLATLLLSAESGRPIIVFSGAALALITTSLVGVILGRWLSKSIEAHIFDLLAGIAMTTIGILLFIESIPSISNSLSLMLK